MDMKMFFPFKSLDHIVYHHFQMMNNLNKCTISIQDIRNIKKENVTWDEPIENVQP